MSYVARSRHCECDKLQSCPERRPAVVFVDGAHERSKLPLVGYSRAMLNVGSQSAPRSANVGSLVARRVTTGEPEHTANGSP